MAVPECHENYSADFYGPMFFAALADKPDFRTRCTGISLGNARAIELGWNLIGHDLAQEFGLNIDSDEQVDINIYALDSRVDTVTVIVADIPFDLALVDPTDLADRTPPPEVPRAWQPGDWSETPFVALPAKVYPTGMPESAAATQILVRASLLNTYGPALPLYAAANAFIPRAVVDTLPGRTGRALPVARHHACFEGVVAEHAIELTVECCDWAFNIDSSIVKGFPEELGFDEYEAPIMLEFEVEGREE